MAPPIAAKVKKPAKALHANVMADPPAARGAVTLSVNARSKVTSGSVLSHQRELSTMLANSTMAKQSVEETNSSSWVLALVSPKSAHCMEPSRKVSGICLP
jgi:hypothetical protein